MLSYSICPLGFFFLLYTSQLGEGRGGVERAVALLQEGIPTTPVMKDIILRGITTPWQNNAYKLQVIRIRLGKAWELAATSYGYSRHHEVDLIDRQRKIAIELKNSKHIGSREKRTIHASLKHFKQEYPDYTVVFGFINAPTHTRDYIREGIYYKFGDSVLQLVFGVQHPYVIRRLRQAVQSHF